MILFTIDEYPWQISLQVQRGGAWGHNCGGSIVDETTVVTAAHCCYGHTASSMQVIISYSQHKGKSFTDTIKNYVIQNLIFDVLNILDCRWGTFLINRRGRHKANS